jgi:DNA-binding transcriptional LysR family regulator
LLARTTRSVALTEAGTHLHDGLKPAFSEVRATLDSLTEQAFLKPSWASMTDRS